MEPIDVLHLATAVIAVLSGVLALYRMSIGPGLLDRTVATDVLTAAGIGVLAVMVVWWQRVDLGVLLVILALTAFMTAVVVTRYAVREDASAKRILTREEAELQDRERAEAELAAEQAELEEAARAARGEAAGEGTPEGSGGGTGDGSSEDREGSEDPGTGDGSTGGGGAGHDSPGDTVTGTEDPGDGAVPAGPTDDTGTAEETEGDA